MEERVSKLEDFQKKWKFYFWAAVVIGSLANATLGWNISKINSKISQINEDINKAEQHLNDLHIKSNVAEKASDNALRQAGDLDIALSEAKIAYQKASEASEQSIKSSKEAIAASQNALKASKESKAISLAVDNKIRKLEQIIAELKDLKKNAASFPSLNKNPFIIKLSGTRMYVRFEEGNSPYENVTLDQSYYNGTIFVPKNRIAKVTGDINYCSFTVAKELKGRVIDNTTGISNRWQQE